jgi:hypothetical protein
MRISLLFSILSIVGTNLLVFETNPALVIKNINIFPLDREISNNLVFTVEPFFTGLGGITVCISDSSRDFESVFAQDTTFVNGQNKTFIATIAKHTIVEKTRLTIAVWKNNEIRKFRSKTITIFPRENKHISINFVRHYVPEGMVCNVSSLGNVQYQNENIWFTNFNDKKEEPIYHHFDFSPFQMMVTSSSHHSEEMWAQLNIEDENNLFPAFSKEGKAVFPMKIRLINNVYIFSLVPIYFNTQTYQLSQERIHQGYEETELVYFPKNSFMEGSKLKFSIEIYKIGFNRTTASFNGEIRYAHPLIGDMDQAMAYISTGASSYQGVVGAERTIYTHA